MSINNKVTYVKIASRSKNNWNDVTDNNLGILQTIGTINKPNNILFTITLDSIPPQPRPRMTMGSLYTNNAQVYYKSHTLAAGGIGGVRNYRLKSRKT